MYPNGQVVRVTFDDENPQLNNQLVKIVKQICFTSPFWFEVEFQGAIFALRESSFYIEPQK